MKNNFIKIAKFISSRLLYLVIGIFLAIGATYVYATWDQAKTGGSAQLGQSNWNALVTEIHNKCGSNCDTIATAATAAGDILTENNWNSLADLLNNTLVNCTANNGGKCFVNETSKSILDANLAAGNIISGVTIFGVAGTANSICYYGSTAQSVNWNAGLYGCTGSDKRCYNGSCVTCGGWMQEGYCWYRGVANQSCNDVCSTHGGVYNGNCNWPGGAAGCWACGHYGGNTSDCSISYGGPIQTEWGMTHKCAYGTYTAPNCTDKADQYLMICACNQ